MAIALVATDAAAGATDKPPPLPPLPDVRGLVRRRARAVVRVESFEYYLPGMVRRTARLLNPFPLRSTLSDAFAFAVFVPSVVIYPLRKHLGSAVLFDPQGYLLTNHHVVCDADRVGIRLTDAKDTERVFRAKVVGTDPQTDIALLKIEPGETPLVVAPLGDSDELALGDWVVAIGNPLNLTGSVSVGVVSGLHRRVRAEPLEDHIQVEAALNPGNSGGPIFNTRGEVCGIVALGIFPSNNIGFAVPVDLIKPVLDDLKTEGHPRRGFLGVGLRDLTPELADKEEIEAEAGALVTEVQWFSPARAAGIHAGDLVVAYAGKAVKKARDVQMAVLRTRPGTSVQVRLLRGGKAITRQVTVGTRRRPFRIF